MSKRKYTHKRMKRPESRERNESIGEEFIKELANHIISKYHERHEKLRKKLNSGVDHFYFVHELCQCRRKERMRTLYPELYAAQVYEPAIMLGELVHLGVETLTHSEKEVVKVKDIKTSIGTARIAGTIDIYYPEEGVAVDVKYVRKLKANAIMEHHKLQVSLYAWLANAKYGEIWYITPEGIRTYGPIKPANENTAKHLIEYPKTPMWPKWECKYCPYTKICPENRV